MRWSTLRWTAAPCACLAAIMMTWTAGAQSPPSYPVPPPYPAPTPPGPAGASEIARCLCLSRDMAALSAELAAKRQSYQSVQDELARIDAQLSEERSRMDVNNPQSVAQFREMLERRDRLFRRSTGPEFAGYSQATEGYNARVNEYNAQCANRPQDPDLVARVRATLSCPQP